MTESKSDNSKSTNKRIPPKENRPKGTILTENFSLQTDKKKDNNN